MPDGITTEERALIDAAIDARPPETTKLAARAVARSGGEIAERLRISGKRAALASRGLRKVGDVLQRVPVIERSRRSPGRGEVRPISVRGLLEWAFQAEHASLDFDELESVAGRALPSFGLEYIMIEQQRLGCRVDGGGRSDPHPDADLVAGSLAVLPEGCGGRRTAIWVAELARAGRAPDWMEDETPRLVAAEFGRNRYGDFAKTENSAELGELGWPAQPRRNRKGVVVYDPVMFTPCRWTVTAQQIAQARRAYLEWWGVLLELKAMFQNCKGLSGFTVTDEMPEKAPWRKTS